MVTALIVHHKRPTVVLSFSDGSSVTCTANHPFYVDGEGFTPAGQLAIGSQIVCRAGPDVRLVARRAGPDAVVYNLTVAGTHTYFVGSDGLWVHNTCGADGKEIHHIIPQQFRDDALKSGIKVDEYCTPLSSAEHYILHHKLFGPRGYNLRWKSLFKPSNISKVVTQTEIKNMLEEMKLESNIPDSEVKSYREWASILGRPR